MFSIFKKASQADVEMTRRSIMKLHTMWHDQGYQKFYFELMRYHHELGNDSAADDALKRKNAIEHLLSESLRACNSTALSNQKAQTMVFTKVSSALNLLEKISTMAYNEDIPFKELIPKPSNT